MIAKRYQEECLDCNDQIQNLTKLTFINSNKKKHNHKAKNKYLKKAPFFGLVLKIMFVTVERITSDSSNSVYLSSEVSHFEEKVYYALFCK